MTFKCLNVIVFYLYVTYSICVDSDFICNNDAYISYI